MPEFIRPGLACGKAADEPSRHLPYVVLIGKTGWEQNGFSALSLLGLIGGPSLSFPFPQAPRLTLLWFLACMLVSLGIGGLWLLLSAQSRSQSNTPSVLYNGFFHGFPGEQMPSYFQESQPLAELSLFLLLLPTYSRGWTRVHVAQATSLASSSF